MGEKEEKYKFTKEECLKIDGHCYENDNFVTNPSTYHRTCKHCGNKQEYNPGSWIVLDILLFIAGFVAGA